MEKIKEDTFSKSNYINYRVNILFYDEKKEEKIDANNIFEIKSLKLSRIDISKSINAKIESKGQKWRRFRESEPQKFLDTRPQPSHDRKNRKQRARLTRVSLTERSLRGQTADSCGTGLLIQRSRFSARTRNPESSTLRLWCHRCARWLPLPRSLPILPPSFPFLPSIRFLPISPRNVIDR